MKLHTTALFLVIWVNVAVSAEVEVKCLLSPVKGTEYVPSGQNVFSSGDILKIKCQQGHWSFGTKATETTVTCNDDGTWSSPANCEKITCDPPDDSGVQYSRWDWSWRRGDLKDTKDYRCKSGYKPTNGATYAECTNDGTWTPNPLCEEITCDPPDDSGVQYSQWQRRWQTGKLKDQINYSCKPKFEPTNGVKFAECTNDGTWTPNPLCEEVKCLLSPIKGTEYVPSGQNVFSSGDILKIKCQQGHWFFGTKATEKTVTCNDDGMWSSPANCEKITCDPPDDSGVQYSRWDWSWRRGDLKDTKDYRCKYGYKPTNGATYAECTNDGTWTPNPLCEALSCVPEATDGRVVVSGIPDGNAPVLFGHKLNFSCPNPEHKLKGSPQVVCTADGSWSNRFPTCNDATCSIVEMNGNAIATMQYGHKLQFECSKPEQVLHGEPEVVCSTNGQWSHPFPQCKERTCGPPPALADGDTVNYKEQYRNGESVYYKCQTYYILSGQTFKKCQNGIWIGHMTCLAPCPVDAEMMAERSITFSWPIGDPNKLYVTHGDFTTFRCTRDKRLSSNSAALRQQCDNGVVNLPRCE
ncbi:hypothetical protein DPEC_G00221660 [Dallia pectoralis]|uniref:Uncharacterized protein n=1 Tax=Dallia pectoralis TaxID=75939 RepID=A0ACC2G440_DALPE|nr:hypothetical protein DPEC_G00221660 [Dallia pectoralis]